MNKKLLSLIAWNSGFVLMYKIVLALHQIALFAAVSHATYGLINACFAAIFFMVSITDFGTDQTIQAWYATIISSPRMLHKSLYALLIKYGTTAVCAFLLGYILTNTSWFTALQTITATHILLITSLFFVESCKRTLHTLMQTTLQTKQLVIIEISLLFLYLTLFWGWYATGHVISVTSSLTPLLFISTLEVGLLGYCMYQKYRALSGQSAHEIKQTLPMSRILPTQLMHYLLQIIKACYTPNMLILLSASYLGLYQTGIVKFFITLISLVYAFLQRAIGTSSASYLANLGHNQERKAQFAASITSYYWIVGSLSILLAANLFGLYLANIPTSTLIPLTLFAGIMCLHYLFIAYEQFFITQQQAHSMLTVQLIITTLLAPFYIFGLFNLAWCLFAALATTLLVLHTIFARQT